METKVNGGRKIYLDTLKIIAMALVFYVHTGIFAMHHYEIAGERSSYWISMAMYVIASAGPTIFFFISGGLLLEKEESLKDVLLKRVLRYAVLLVLFKFIQLLILIKTNPVYTEIYREKPVNTVLKVLYSDEVIAQYWFLHSYLAFLLILPFLRAMVQKIKDEYLVYLICLYLVIKEALVIVEYYWESPRIGLDMPFFNMGIIAPCIGYCFVSRFKDITKKLKFMLPINLLGLFFIGFDIYYSNTNYINTGNISMLGGTGIVIAILLFADIKALCDLKKEDYPEWLQVLLGICASGSLITFLLDPQIHSWTEPAYDFAESKTNWLGGVIIWAICGLAIGILIALILRLIPFVGILFGAKPQKKKGQEE